MTDNELLASGVTGKPFGSMISHDPTTLLAVTVTGEKVVWYVEDAVKTGSATPGKEYPEQRVWIDKGMMKKVIGKGGKG